MRPLSLFDYKVLRAAVAIAAYTLLEKDDDAEFLDEMVSFLRGHCGRCAKELPKKRSEKHQDAKRRIIRRVIAM